MRKHKTIKLNVKCEDHYHKVGIDVKIAPLIQEMWEADIETYNSCQEDIRHDGYAWIQFKKGKDIEKFVSVVCDVGSKVPGENIDIYHHMVNVDTSVVKGSKKVFMIEYELNDTCPIFYDHQEDFKEDYPMAKRPIINLELSANLFIRCDIIPLLTDKMKLYNSVNDMNVKKKRIGFVCSGVEGFSSYVHF